MTHSKCIAVEPEFSDEQFTLVLRISKNDTAISSRKLEADDFRLSEKDEFHLTVVGTAAGREILGLFGNPVGEEREALGKKISDLGKSIDWKVTLQNEFYYIRKHYGDLERRESIIQMAEIENIGEFYKRLEDLFGEEFMPPVPHVTLYTTSTREDKKLWGIGLHSMEEFKELEPERI